MEQCVTALKNHSPESRQNKERLWEIRDLLCHPNLSCRRKMKDSKKCPDITRTVSLLLCPLRSYLWSHTWFGHKDPAGTKTVIRALWLPVIANQFPH